MARLPKQGIDYFPFDVHNDTGLMLVEAEFGLVGFAVIVKLLQNIYGEKGYYYPLDENTAKLFAYQNHLSGEEFDALIAAAIRQGIFDEKLYQEYAILTSEEIQRQYLLCAVRRQCIDMNEEFLLIPKEELGENVCMNGVFVNINSQSKEKEKEKKKKGNEKKEKVRKREKADFLPKKSAFCNYQDTNEIDFDALQEKLLDNNAAGA